MRIKTAAAIKILPILLVVTAFAITGCGSDSTGTTETKTSGAKTGTVNTGTVKVTESDAGSTVNLAKGATLEVTLKSNPSTGYHWVVTSIDQSCLKKSGDPVYTPDANSQGMMGAGGKDTFSFDAVSAGEALVLMDYLSPANEPSETSFSITVNVQA